MWTMGRPVGIQGRCGAKPSMEVAAGGENADGLQPTA